MPSPPTPLAAIPTAAGVAAAATAISNGLQVAFTHIQLGTGQYTPAVNGSGYATQTALVAPVQAVAISGGGNIPNTTEVDVYGYFTASGAAYFAGEIGFWNGDPASPGSTLMMVYSAPGAQIAWINTISAAAMQLALSIAAFAAGSINVTVNPDPSALAYLLGQHTSQSNPHPQYSLVQPGVMVDFAGSSPPSGYLACDGSAVSRVTFANLFTAIGTTWGPGDGSTTFNVPDSRRRVAVGSGGASSAVLANTVGANGGEENHTLSQAELPNVQLGGGVADDLNTAFPNGYTTAGLPGAATNTMKTDDASYTPTYQGLTEPLGSGNSHNNMQPAYVVLKMIRY